MIALSELSEKFGARIIGDGSVKVQGIVSDSRMIKGGELFAACKGAISDGTLFAKDAERLGAAAVITDKEIEGLTVPQVIVDDITSRLGPVSSFVYGEPSAELKLTSVTGTNGKTTVAYLSEAIFKAAGFSSGFIGTINYRFCGTEREASHTTPVADVLQGMLSEMVECGTEYCVMEVSSHALDQRRVDGSLFDVKVFTNLTPEHLDYHKDMSRYFESKVRLFTDKSLSKRRSISVVNIDGEYGVKLADIIGNKGHQGVVTYSLSNDANIFPESWDVTLDGIEAVVDTPGGHLSIKSALIGEHNLHNILAAIGVGLSYGLDIEDIEKGINELKCVPGRLESVSNDKGINAFVDYAHTPDALERTLKVLKELDCGRLITVFGCGGDRDKEKRPVMGASAARLSDVAIVTSDNPRGEEPGSIIDDVVKGIVDVLPFDMEEPGKGGYITELDREKAIEVAVSIAQAGDTLLIAGKGHEDYQIIGAEKTSFDDRVVLGNFLRDK